MQGFCFIYILLQNTGLIPKLRRKLSPKLNSTYGQWVAPKHIRDCFNTGKRESSFLKTKNTCSKLSLALIWNSIIYGDYRVNSFLWSNSLSSLIFCPPPPRHISDTVFHNLCNNICSCCKEFQWSRGRLC